MRVRKVHFLKDLRTIWSISAQMRQYLKGDINHNPETVFSSMCANPEGGYYDAVQIMGGIRTRHSFTIVAHPELARSILASADIERDKRRMKFFSLTGRQGIAGSSGSDWKRQRLDVLAHLTPDIIQEQYQEIEVRAIDAFSEYLNSELKKKGKFDFCPEQVFRQIAFDILSEEMGFDLPPELIDDFYKLVSSGFENLSSFFGISALALDSYIDTALQKKNSPYVQNIHDAFDRTIDNKIRAIREHHAADPLNYSPGTLMEKMIFLSVQTFSQDRRIDFGRALDLISEDPAIFNAQYRNQIKEEACHIIYAGHDTSGNLLSWSIHQLAASPELQSRIYNEVKDLDEEKIKKEGAISIAVVRKFLFETLRMYPSLGNTMPRVVINDTVVQYGSEDNQRSMPLDKNTVIFLPISLYHKHPDYFDRPEEFDIDRDHKTAAFMPFASGRHTCPGRNLALNRAAYTLFELVRNFEFLSQDKVIPRKVFVNGMSITPEDDSHVQVRKRKDGFSYLLPHNTNRRSVGRLEQYYA